MIVTIFSTQVQSDGRESRYRTRYSRVQILEAWEFISFTEAVRTGRQPVQQCSLRVATDICSHDTSCAEVGYVDYQAADDDQVPCPNANKEVRQPL